jgi:hypothetical protein
VPYSSLASNPSSPVITAKRRATSSVVSTTGMRLRG